MKLDLVTFSAQVTKLFHSPATSPYQPDLGGQVARISHSPYRAKRNAV